MAQINRTKKIKAFLMLFYIILFLVDSFFHIKLWTTIMAPIVLIISLIAFPSVKGFNKCLSSVLFSVGAYLLIKSNASLNTWADALTKNSGITVLLLSVPLLSIIFYFEDFNTPILNFTEKHIHSEFSFYIFITLVTNFFGMILNVASLPLVSRLLDSVRENHPRKMFYKALTRGYILGQVWAPNFLSVGVALQYSGLQWHKYAPLGFLISAMGMMLSLIMARITIKDKKLNSTSSDTENQAGGYGSIFKIAGIAVFLIIFIIGLQYLSGKNVMVIVPLVSVLFPSLLSVLLKKTIIYEERFKIFYDTTLPGMNNEMVLFTSVGFLGHALGVSGVDRYIPSVIKSIGISSPLLLILFIIALIYVLSLIGLHPVLTISTISIAYSAGVLPLSQVQLAAVFVMGYFVYTLTSPFSGMLLAVVSIDHENPLNVGINMNLIFSVLLICLASVVIAAW